MMDVLAGWVTAPVAEATASISVRRFMAAVAAHQQRQLELERQRRSEVKGRIRETTVLSASRRGRATGLISAHGGPWVAVQITIFSDDAGARPVSDCSALPSRCGSPLAPGQPRQEAQWRSSLITLARASASSPPSSISSPCLSGQNAATLTLSVPRHCPSVGTAMPLTTCPWPQPCVHSPLAKAGLQDPCGQRV